MKPPEIIIVILLSAFCTFALRALPFIAFRGEKEMPAWLQKLGTALPSAIMAVLIVYCLRDAGTDWTGIGIPKLLAAAAVVFTYRIKHNTFFSIIAGTAGYMLLLHFL